MRISQGTGHSTLARHTDAHLFAAMNIIMEEKTISRGRLSEELGLGEGSTRSIIDTMKAWKQVEVKRQGVSLTAIGLETIMSIPMKFVSISSTKYVKGGYQQGILVKNRADRIADGMTQRDLGIRFGSDGASVFIMREDHIIFPKDVDLDTSDPEFAERIHDLGIENGDVLIIVGSDDLPTSRISAAGIGLVLI